MKEKAYKLLARQENITNRSAKDLIDRGVVYALGKKIILARALMGVNTRFKIEDIDKLKIIFEDENLVVVDKPAYVSSEQISKKIGHKLLHRLDKETSGILLLVKDEDFRKRAILEFKNQNVKKEYIAWVSGIVSDEIVIDKPILTIRKNRHAFSKISEDGKKAISFVKPLMIEAKSTKVKVIIKTGRTHQIRIHLKSEGYPIIGDKLYGGKDFKRVMLHAHKLSLFDYNFISNEPKGFNLSNKSKN